MKLAVLLLSCALLQTGDDGFKIVVEPGSGEAPALQITWQEAAELLRGADRYESKGIGFGGHPSHIWRGFDVLRRKAPTEVLQELALDPSPVVRAYAMEALIERGEDFFPILYEQLADPTEMRTIIGCISDRKSVVEHLLWRAQDRL